MDSTPDIMRELLSGKGLKITPQRVIIGDYLIHCDSHPTADELFEAVEPRLPGISKATVYNTLNTLVDAGIIHAVSTEPGRIRYDANRVPHHHFVDVNTGQIIDIPWERVDQLCQSLGADFRIRDYQITFYGDHTPNA